ncbi:hypothetical protein MSPP1_002149 [Malassezia sp. CBS 17886]|nr:hypothetical protein MSPP1_002149 [Malassezia sp. CBS 17886]
MSMRQRLGRPRTGVRGYPPPIRQHPAARQKAPDVPLPAPSALEQVAAELSLYAARIYRVFFVRPAAIVVHTCYAVFLSPTLHRLILRLTLLTAIQAACVGLAILAYAGFYYTWVPSASVSKEMYFDYGDADWPVWQRDVPVPLFVEDQLYDVSLELILPVNTVNQGLVLLTPEPSEPVSPTQMVRIPMLRQIAPASTEWTTRPWKETSVKTRGYTATRAIVHVGRNVVDAEVAELEGVEAFTHADMRALRRIVQVQRATLRFDARLMGTIYYMYYYPFISLAVFVLIFASIEFIVAAGIWGVVSVYFSFLNPS